MIQYHKASIKNGKFQSDRKLFQERVASLPDGNYFLMLIKQQDRTERDFQNHYFAILGEWSLDCGYTKEELHELIKEELFTELFDGAISTSMLTVEQWNIVFLNLENFLILKFENS
jgi:hypothetical protein